MENDLRLSRIETLWSVVQQAHHREIPIARAAQQRLIQQYGGAVRRYLLAALKNEDAADEVFQEFALRFVRGDFQSANPTRGRFRSFVKTSIYHLIVDYQRRAVRDGRLRDVTNEGQHAASLEQMDAEFTASWRKELLSRAWAALSDRELSSGTPYYTVLRFRADHPELRSPELAAELSQVLGKAIQAGNARVLVHRSREVFADLLIDTVEESLENPTYDELENELIMLDLLSYCRPALEKRRDLESISPSG